jgi:hypothetical protein
MVDVANGWFGPMLGQNHHFNRFAKEKFLMRLIVISMKPNAYMAYLKSS